VVAHAAGAHRAGIAVDGFGVPHAHVHIVPVWQRIDLDPCRQALASEDELRRGAERLQSALAESELVDG